MSRNKSRKYVRTAPRKFAIDHSWLREQYEGRGRRNADLCRELGCSPPTLLRALKAAGISARDDRAGAIRLRRRVEFDLEQAKLLYVENRMNCKDIGTKFGVNGSTILRRLREAGVRIRHHNETKRGRPNHSRKYPNKMAVCLDYLRQEATLRSTAKTFRLSVKIVLRTLNEARVPLKGQKWSRSGAGNPNWNPDLTDEERSLRRNTRQNTIFRNLVFKRDGFVCKRCGYDRGKILNAHHIEGHRDNKKDRYNPDNGITLCVPCHLGFHREYGFIGFGRQELDKWIASYA